MYQMAQQLGGRTSTAIRKFGIGYNQGNIVTHYRQDLRTWENYTQYFYDSENRPKSIAIEAEWELDEDGKGHTMLKSELKKTIEDM